MMRRDRKDNRIADKEPLMIGVKIKMHHEMDLDRMGDELANIRQQLSARCSNSSEVKHRSECSG